MYFNSRRAFLSTAFNGIGALALGSMRADEARADLARRTAAVRERHQAFLDRIGRLVSR